MEVLDDLHSLVVKIHLLGLHLFEDLDPSGRVHEPLGVHLLKESLDGVLLFKLMESYGALLPGRVVGLELLLVCLDDLFVEFIVLCVLRGILGFVLLSEFNKEVVDCWLKQECY